MKYPVIAHNFKLFKSRLNCTAKELAVKLGSKQPTIESYCDGRSKPGAELAMKVANLFNIQPEQIFNQSLTEQDLSSTGRTQSITEVKLEAAERENELLRNTVADLRLTVSLLRKSGRKSP